ncbi:hypothetical protein QTP86_034809 [Hemibagrus guttatus]|nr:hypothetical protein QTP86_034809 [Hemibagrus guttatus]
MLITQRADMSDRVFTLLILSMTLQDGCNIPPPKPTNHQTTKDVDMSNVHSKSALTGYLTWVLLGIVLLLCFYSLILTVVYIKLRIKISEELQITYVPMQKKGARPKRINQIVFTMDVNLTISLMRGQMGVVIEKAVNTAVETVLGEMIRVMSLKFEQLRRDMTTKEKENEDIRKMLESTRCQMKILRQKYVNALNSKDDRRAFAPHRHTLGQMNSARHTVGQVDTARHTAGHLNTAAHLDPTRHSAGPLDPTRHSAGQLDPTRHAAGQLDPTRHAAGQLDPNRHAAGQLDPNRHAAGQLDPTRHAAGQLDPTRHAAGQLDPTRHAAGQLDPSRHAAGQLDPTRHAAGQLDPTRHAAGQLDPTRHAAGQLDPTRHAAGQLDPTRHAAGQLDPTRHAAGQLDPSRHSSGQLHAAGQLDPTRHTAGQLDPTRHTAGQLDLTRHTASQLDPTRHTASQLDTARVHQVMADHVMLPKRCTLNTGSPCTEPLTLALKPRNPDPSPAALSVLKTHKVIHEAVPTESCQNAEIYTEELPEIKVHLKVENSNTTTAESIDPLWGQTPQTSTETEHTEIADPNLQPVPRVSEALNSAIADCRESVLKIKEEEAEVEIVEVKEEQVEPSTSELPRIELHQHLAGGMAIELPMTQQCIQIPSVTEPAFLGVDPSTYSESQLAVADTQRQMHPFCKDLMLYEDYKRKRIEVRKRSETRRRELERTLPQALLADLVKERREKTRLRVARWRAKRKLQACLMAQAAQFNSTQAMYTQRNGRRRGGATPQHGGIGLGTAQSETGVYTMPLQMGTSPLLAAQRLSMAEGQTQPGASVFVQQRTSAAGSETYQ